MLPPPMLDGRMSVERAMKERRSSREYQEGSISLIELSQLLWAAQGVTGKSGKRTAPSAGALYPLRVYVVAIDIRGLAGGVYRYGPDRHELERVVEDDIREELFDAALGQDSIEGAGAAIVIAAIFEKTRAKYGRRSDRYVFVEVGHAAQNIYLQSVPLGLGTVMVGAFEGENVRRLCGMGREERPVAIMPIGQI